MIGNEAFDTLYAFDKLYLENDGYLSLDSFEFVQSDYEQLIETMIKEIYYERILPILNKYNWSITSGYSYFKVKCKKTGSEVLGKDIDSSDEKDALIELKQWLSLDTPIDNTELHRHL